MSEGQLPLSWQVGAALNDAVTEQINQLAPDLPPLRWTIREYGSWVDDGVTGHPTGGDVDPDNNLATIHVWVTRLGLKSVRAMPGVVKFAGQVSDLAVQIFYVHNREAFNNEAARLGDDGRR